MTVVKAICLLLLVGLLTLPPVYGAVNDDKYDGNIFVLYGGNGSLVPPRVTLQQSIGELHRPALLFFYVDDSADCKRVTPLLNQVQLYYSKLVSIIPINVDSLIADKTTAQYYGGFVPQWVLVSTDSQVVYNYEGLPEPADLDKALRSVVGIDTPSPMAKLKNDSPFFNEFNR
ncbi:MAG: thylakoid membrane photosystem I accumulation factor [Pseudanabaenaceae cyanobacterium SKYGB_i_bin29]|nr:thylakoid membrane photosystem I accumulation factor [Pseudanabaenaceae cyanobacterium SKYG29]MDW8421726.1 thylakoid membrane photosystem I accumulation factor [Pseudanabaenaceae cyanobacterium SKYGB_i_bin29]